ncbi:MAG: demethoxyubiquinone hydroxylase family protein [Alphaproteobacteria bacterium]
MKNKLPGDKDSKKIIEEIIRVNHAGEYGAKRIYEGQLAVLKDTPSYQTISHMKDQEEKHLKYFEEQLKEKRIRPSILFPLWHVGGYILGVTTSLLGEKAAMACTEAVEEVISEHYEKQIEILDSDPKLREKIQEFRNEEIEHQNTAIHNSSYDAPIYSILTNTIKFGCKTAIWLAKRF